MRSEIIYRLKTKKCILCGTSERVREFYTKYGEQLDILCCSDVSELVVKTEMYADIGIPMYVFDDELLSRDAIFIICDSEQFYLYMRMLLASNKEEYVDFLSIDLAISIMANKPIAVCMGSQIMVQIYNCISHVSQFVDKYDAYLFSQDELYKPYKDRYLEYKHLTRFSELYIYTKSEMMMFQSKILQDDEWNNECIRIVIPDAEFNGFFPQICADRNEYSSYFYREFDRLDMYYGTIFGARADVNIEHMITKGVSSEGVCKKILNDGYYDEEYVKQHFEKSIRHFVEWEEGCDVMVSDLIRDSSKCVYSNIDEWTVDLVIAVAERVLEKLDMVSAINQQDVASYVEKDMGTEIPVYPSVACALGLVENEKNIYRVRSFDKEECLSIDEYLKYWAESIYRIIQLESLLNGGEIT